MAFLSRVGLWHIFRPHDFTHQRTSGQQPDIERTCPRLHKNHGRQNSLGGGGGGGFFRWFLGFFCFVVCVWRGAGARGEGVGAPTVIWGWGGGGGRGVRPKRLRRVTQGGGGGGGGSTAQKKDYVICVPSPSTYYYCDGEAIHHFLWSLHMGAFAIQPI